MSKEFKKLEALLGLYEPSDHDPQVNRDEAAKHAARLGWLVHRRAGDASSVVRCGSPRQAPLSAEED
jgi:hypothetical protein